VTKGCRKDDALPERYFAEAVPGGLPVVKGTKMDREKFEKMLHEYYDFHGWDKKGRVPQKTIEKLSLEKAPSHLL
jgi:aldehyde:ferredoxin oxidoreductase